MILMLLLLKLHLKDQQSGIRDSLWSALCYIMLQSNELRASHQSIIMRIRQEVIWEKPFWSMNNSPDIVFNKQNPLSLFKHSSYLPFPLLLTIMSRFMWITKNIPNHISISFINPFTNHLQFILSGTHNFIFWWKFYINILSFVQ